MQLATATADSRLQVADPQGLPSRWEQGSCPASLPSAAGTIKRTKIKQTYPEPSPEQAAGEDTTKRQQEEADPGCSKHQGQRAQCFGAHPSHSEQRFWSLEVLGPQLSTGTATATIQLLPTQVKLCSARKQELHHRASEQGEAAEAKCGVQTRGTK